MPLQSPQLPFPKSESSACKSHVNRISRLISEHQLRVKVGMGHGRMLMRSDNYYLTIIIDSLATRLIEGYLKTSQRRYSNNFVSCKYSSHFVFTMLFPLSPISSLHIGFGLIFSSGRRLLTLCFFMILRRTSYCGKCFKW
jgi:hypothetical protein